MTHGRVAKGAKLGDIERRAVDDRPRGVEARDHCTAGGEHRRNPATAV